MTGRHLYLFFLLLLAASLVAVGFLWRQDDATERYKRTAELLHQLKQLDTELDKDVVRVMAFRLPHYDSMVAYTQEIRRIQKELADPQLGFIGDIHREIDEGFNSYLEAERTKNLSLERLKSRVASARNTLQYLPKVGRDYMAGSRAAYADQVAQLLIALQSYNLLPGERLRKEVDALSRTLEAAGGPEAERRQLANIAFHARANLAARDDVQRLMGIYSAVQTSQQIENIKSLFQQHHSEKAVENFYFGLFLSLVTLLLLAVLGLVVRNLWHTRAEAEAAWGRLHDAIESVSEAFSLYDANDRLVLWNSKFAEFYPRIRDKLAVGANYGTLMRKAVEAGQFDESQYAQEDLLQRLTESHRQRGEPLVEYLDDGRCYLARDSKTATGGISSIRIDITERLKMEERLRDLSQAVEQSPASVLITDLEGRIEYVNPKFEDISGYTLEEVRGQKPSILKSGEKSSEEYRALWETISVGQVWQGEFHNRRKDGELYWESASISCIRDEKGRMIHYLAIKEDITARKLAEEQLRLAATVFDTSTEAIMVTDAENRIKTVNPGFTVITGYLPEEVIGKNPSMLSSGRHNEDFYRLMWKSLQEQRVWEGEIWNRRKNGESYAEWLSLSAITDKHGEVVEYVAVFSDITRRKQDEELIRRQANYDALTELPNRTLFFDRLSHALLNAQRESWNTALLFIDLDNFKLVNDTLGHAYGDELLQQVAGRIQSCVREADTVARLGGDEFTVILQDIHGEANASKVAEQVIDSLTRPFDLQGNEAFIGASIGITVYPDDGTDAPTLIRNADMAMYKAKEAGKNAYRFFTPEMDEQMLNRMAMESDMRQSLKDGDFYLEFQPIVSMATEQVASAEALIRWHHPTKGTIQPEQFIPIAEESGLIGPLGDWALEKACRQAKQWLESGEGEFGVTVNLSSRQLKLGFNAMRLAEILHQTGLPARSLTLEITEGLMMEESPDVLQCLREIRLLGVSIAVDDFGTGYSSLRYLKKFPVNAVKIDRSFITDMTTNEEDASLVEAIIAMANSLGLRLVAEGVETAGQVEFLRQRQCDYIQGFYYSKPLSAEKFIAYAKANKGSRQYSA